MLYLGIIIGLLIAIFLSIINKKVAPTVDKVIERTHATYFQEHGDFLDIESEHEKIKKILNEDTTNTQ